MLNFDYRAPTRLIFGKGEEGKVGRRIADYGGSKALVVFEGTGLEWETRLIDGVSTSLQESGVEVVLFSGIKPNPEVARARAAAEVIRAQDVDFVLGVGGGSAIDTAKFAAVQARYAGDLWEDCFLRRDKPVPQARVPLGTIITLAGTGTEASEACLLKSGSVKRGMDNAVMQPVFSILNPELTFSVPAYPTACGAADILCHLHESYFTNTPDVWFMDELIEGAMRTVIKYAPIAVTDPMNYDARAQLMLAGTFANSHLTWCGREDDGAVHFIQEPISALYDTAHGAGVAVITVGWMKYVYHNNIPRFVRYFTKVWNLPSDEFDPESVVGAGIERQIRFYEELGLSVHAKDVGVRDEDIEELARAAEPRSHGKVGNFVRLGEEDIVRILRLCA